MEQDKFVQVLKLNDLNYPVNMNPMECQVKVFEKGKKYHSLAITNRLKIKTYVPILPLKIATCMWFASARSGLAYYTVFLKSTGLTVTEMSATFVGFAALQTILAPVIGAISDKFAIPKLTLIVSILFTGFASIGIVFVPKLSSSHCEPSSGYKQCQAKGSWNGTKRTLFFDTNTIPQGCEVMLPYDTLCWNSNNTGSQTNSSWIQMCSFYQELASCVDRICVQKSDLHSIDVNCDYENRNFHFVLLMILLFFFNLFYGSCFRFFNATATFIVKEHDSGYGAVRVWAIAGSIVGPIISSYAVYYASSKSSVDYEVSFYVYAALCLLTSIMAFQMEIHSNPGKQMWSKGLALLKNPEITIFAFSLIVLGTTFGFFNAFSQWYLADIGAPPYMFGFLFSFSDVVGVPVMIYSKWIFCKIGSDFIVLMALIARVIVCLGYAYMRSPWISFPLEIFGVFHYHLVMLVMMQFVRDTVHEDLTATAHSLTNPLHFCIGRLLGGTIGGVLMETVGSRMSFFVMGIINLSYAVIFVVLLSIRKACQK